MSIISIVSGNIYFKFTRCRCNRKLCTVAIFMAVSIITCDNEVTRNGYRVFPGVKNGRGLTLTPHPF